MKLRLKKFKKINIKPKNIISITILFMIIIIFLVLKDINKKATPILMDYAEVKATSLATLIINQTISEKVLKNIKKQEILITEKDENNKILSIDLDPIVVNKMLSLVTNYVQEYLEKIEIGDIDSLGLSDNVFKNYNKEKLKHGIICEIPSGIIFRNSMLLNLGPKIPVRINMIGDVLSDVDTSITNYGINNALLKVSLKVTVNIQVALPFVKKNIKVDTNIPIIVKVIQGVVPNMYYDLSGIKK